MGGSGTDAAAAAGAAAILAKDGDVVSGDDGESDSPEELHWCRSKSLFGMASLHFKHSVM